MFKVPNSVLVFAAHQDDETIGPGGTLRKWANAGCHITVVHMTDGATGVDQTRVYEKEIRGTRASEADRAIGILGCQDRRCLWIPCQQVANNIETFHSVIEIIRKVGPDLILTHANNDKHRDHKTTSEIIVEAAWKAQEDIHPNLGNTHLVTDVWAFEITDLLPRVDFVVDISETFSVKENAFSVYESQQNVVSGMASHIDGLSRVRGYSVGVERGEAFMRFGKLPVVI